MVLDIIFLLVLLMGVFLGYRQGLIRSILSFLAWFFGLMVAVKFSHSLSVYFAETLGWQGDYIPLISFILLLVGVILIVRVLAILLEKIADTLFLGFFNKALGVFLWCASLALAYSTLLWYLYGAGIISPEAAETSKTFPYVYTLAPKAFNLIAGIIPFFDGMFESLEQFFKNSSNN